MSTNRATRKPRKQSIRQVNVMMQASGGGKEGGSDMQVSIKESERAHLQEHLNTFASTVLKGSDQKVVPVN